MSDTSRDISWDDGDGAALSKTQSYSWIILNAVFDRLSASSLFSGFAVKRISSAMPIEAATQIPFVGVFLGEESMVSDGDLNATTIKFVHTVPIGVQIVVRDNDPTRMLQTLDRASWFAFNQLLRDNTLTNMLETSLPDNVRIEGWPRIRIRPDVWGLTGSKNETPLGERVFWLTYQIRTWFAPTDFPDLERITVTAFPELPPADQNEIQSVKVVYEFNPDSVPLPLPPDP
jgi:hypothetical protein